MGNLANFFANGFANFLVRIEGRNHVKWAFSTLTYDSDSYCLGRILVPLPEQAFSGLRVFYWVGEKIAASEETCHRMDKVL